MTFIDKQSSNQNSVTPIEKGLTFLLPKQASNYLFKQTSSLSPILSANKKTLGHQQVTWTTPTKSAFTTCVLGLTYLSYHYLRTKPAPSPSILPNISVSDMLGTTIKVVGGIGLLTLLYSELGKRESFTLLKNNSVNNPPSSFQQEKQSLEDRIIERFQAAEKEFTTNINEFTSACEEIIKNFDLVNSRSCCFIINFVISIQKKIKNPSMFTIQHLQFSNMLEGFFDKLLNVNTNLALKLAKTCAKLEYNTINSGAPLFKSCQSIIEKALNDFTIGLRLAIDCAQKKKSDACEQVAKKAATIFFKKEGHLFTDFLKGIAWGTEVSLLETILDDTKLFETAAKLELSLFIMNAKQEACTKIKEIFDIFIEANNFIMATSLLQKCATTENKNLQDWAENEFYVHKVSLLEASPDAANQLSDHFEKLVKILIDQSYELAIKETQKDKIKQRQKTLL